MIHSTESPSLLERLIESHRKHQSETTIASYEVAEDMMRNYGILTIDPHEVHATNSRVVSIIEKPRPKDTPSRLAIGGRYVFNSDIFTRIRQINPASNKELYLTDAIAKQIKIGKMVRTLKLGNKDTRYDIGNHLAYFKTFIDYAIADPDYGSEVREYLKNQLKKMKTAFT